MGLSISVGILDGFGLAMFLPLLQMADGSTTIDPEGMGKFDFLLEGMQSMGFNLTLVTVLLMMCLFFIFKGAAQYLNGWYYVNLRQFFIKTIRINLSMALGRMSYKSFLMADAGRIQNTMSGEVSRVSKAYESYFDAFQQIVMVLVYMSFAFFIDFRFAFLICLGGGLTSFIYKRLYKATKISSMKLTKGSNRYQGLIIQFVANFKYLKATRYLKEYNKKLLRDIDNIEESNRKIGQLGVIINALREPILIIIVTIVILLQVKLMGGSMATILISLLFFYRALAALIQLQTSYNNFLAVSGSLENMTGFENELEDAREKDGKEKISVFQETIKLKDAGFNFSSNVILKNISLTIYKNQTIAFVGESGSGKTTLINILTGLMPLSEGEMLVDGIDSKTLNKESYSRRIGYITQEPVIFSDTIFNNVSFWSDPTSENMERFQWAIHQASLDSFIEELPEKELTMLGNNGNNLSGGQKQRISIARELYKDVDILVLDEATSALDSETEDAIQKGLEKLQGKYTILMVAHRLSTVKNSDRIVVMNKGVVVDEGSFGELLVNSSRFQKMVELQEV